MISILLFSWGAAENSAKSNKSYWAPFLGMFGGWGTVFIGYCGFELKDPFIICWGIGFVIVLICGGWLENEKGFDWADEYDWLWDVGKPKRLLNVCFVGRGCEGFVCGGGGSDGGKGRFNGGGGGRLRVGLVIKGGGGGIGKEFEAGIPKAGT